MLKKIFGKKSHTLESLTADYKTLDSSRKQMADKLEELKRGALRASDTKKAVDDIQKASIELELIDSGLDEIKDLMAGIMRHDIDEAYKNLPKMKEDYQDLFSKSAREAGQLLGRGLAIMNVIKKGSMSRLSAAIVDAHNEISKIQNKDYAELAQGFDQARCITPDLPDFMELRKNISLIEGRTPGAESTEAGIRIKVERLLAG